MPRYRNTSGEIIGKSGGIAFLPNEEKDVYRIFDDDPRLLKISDAPYYNPIIKVDNVIFSGANDNKEIIVNYKSVPIVIIQSVKDCDLKVYINSLDNEPAIPVGEGEKLNLRSFRVVSKLILNPSEAGSCKVVQKIEKDQGTGTYV